MILVKHRTASWWAAWDKRHAPKPRARVKAIIIKPIFIKQYQPATDKTKPYKDISYRQHRGERCESCTATTDLHAHHSIPLSQGGTNDKDNIITLCFDCHKELHPHMPNKWRKTS